MEYELKTFIVDRLQQTVVTPITKLTTGIEHEFFLMQPDGAPADHTSSQLFLEALARHKNWYVRETCETAQGPMINRISHEHGNGRYSSIKYDHHPHLLEVAFGYEMTLHDLYDSINRIFELLQNTAQKVGTVVSHSPSLVLDSEDPRLKSELQDFQNLRHYRNQLFINRNQIPRFTNYAAVIAASQVHIGGTGWWKDPSFVEKLYALEPYILGYAIQDLVKTPGEIQQLLTNRWEGYQTVFDGFPLVAFPNLTEWSLDTWTNALLRSPLAAGSDCSWAGQPLAALLSSPFNNWNDFFKSVRDLQIIRPRLFGTLEFRADPAQPSAKKLVSLAALRLGLCTTLLADATIKTPRFNESRALWLNTIKTGHILDHDAILELAHRGLKIRSANEEIYLER